MFISREQSDSLIVAALIVCVALLGRYIVRGLVEFFR